MDLLHKYWQYGVVLSLKSDITVMLFFPNSLGFANLGHTQMTNADPDLENFIVMEPEL